VQIFFNCQISIYHFVALNNQVARINWRRSKVRKPVT
jgi:hypothetical protein